MKKRLLSVCLLSMALLLCIPTVLAMSTQEKEDRYKAAVLQLESYLEAKQHAPDELEPIRAAFDELSQFRQSNFLKYYTIVLIRVEKDEFDSTTDRYLLMLENGFDKALDDLPDTPIGSAEELTAYVRGRECQYKEDAEKACDYYEECLSFYDAFDRYDQLMREKEEKTYQDAVDLFDAGRIREAYDLFLTVSRYKDSGVYLALIETELAHVWVEADCTHPRTCTHCGKTEGKALGHDWQDATCTAPKTCARCGKTSGKKLGHDWEDATCTTPKTCKRCGTTSGKALGHDWKIIDCDHPQTCARCGAKESAAAGHDWQAATCTAPKTCARCGKTSGKALGHDWQNATCTAPKTCKRCGATSGNALGHDWQAATCTAPKTCKRCGATSGKALGHDWQAATCTAPKTCKRCGKTSGSALGHDWQAATCTAAKTCKRCGKTSGKALGHDWINATYTAPKTCARCGATSGKPLDYGQTGGVQQFPGTAHQLWLRNTSLEYVRPQCGPGDNYKTFASKADDGSQLYQTSQISYYYAHFCVGDWVYVQFGYSDRVVRFGFFKKSLFEPAYSWSSIPSISLSNEKRGRVTSDVTPRNGPSSDCGAYSSCKLYEGTTVYACLESNGWYYCRFYNDHHNKYGYIYLWVPGSYINWY